MNRCNHRNKSLIPTMDERESFTWSQLKLRHVLIRQVNTTTQIKATLRKAVLSIAQSIQYIDGLVQDCSNSNAFAIGLLLSCTKPSI